MVFCYTFQNVFQMDLNADSKICFGVQPMWAGLRDIHYITYGPLLAGNKVR